MDNEFLNELIQQFPEFALIVCFVSAMLWLLKTIIDIKNKLQGSKFNKKILEISLSTIKSQELINKLNTLQDIVSELDAVSNRLTNRQFVDEIKELRERLESLENELPEDYKFRKTITVKFSWLNSFVMLGPSIENILLGQKAKDRNSFDSTLSEFSQKVEMTFFAIEEIINSILRYKSESESAIDRVSALKGAGALCLAIFFGFSLNSQYENEKKLQLLASRNNELIQTNDELSHLNTLNEELLSNVNELENRLKVASSTSSIMVSNLRAINRRYGGVRYAEHNDSILDSITELTSYLESGYHSSKDLLKETLTVSTDRLGIILSWNEVTDLDLSLFTPSGESLSYYNLRLDSISGFLDDDFQSGPAREAITINNLTSGKYEILITNYLKEKPVSYTLEISSGSEKITILQGVVHENNDLIKLNVK